MGSIEVALVVAAIGLVLGSYGYTFIVQRDSSAKWEELDRAWMKTADEMRKARDQQLSEIKNDMQSAISALTVSLYDFKLHAATHFATTRSVEQVETNLTAVIGKVESTLERKLDRLTEMVKNGHP